MPSVSAKQHKFMAAIAHNPAFAKKVGIPQSVGKDFNEADKGKKFGSGGVARPDLQKINKPTTLHGKMSIMKEGGDTMNAKMKMFEKSGKDVEKKGMKEGSKADMALDKKQMMGMKKGGMKKMAAGGSASKRADGVASKGKTKGMMVAMKMGGKAC
jgi:hypothetical protein